jgi:hypothetical protein
MVETRSSAYVEVKQDSQEETEINIVDYRFQEKMVDLFDTNVFHYVERMVNGDIFYNHEVRAILDSDDAFLID